MEIMKEEVLEHDKLVKKDIEKDKSEDEGDYLVQTIGAFGLWQGVVSVTVSLNRGVAMWNMLSLSFLTPFTDFSCIQFKDNITTDTNNSICYDNCLKYKYSSIIGRSIIEDFELICQNAWLASFTQSILMMGILIGVSIFGWISDRFGRRTAMLLSTFLNAIFMIALPFSPNYTIFTSIRFLIGVATGGSLIICVVQVMEIVGKQYIEMAGACTLIPDSIAQAALAGFAYFTSDWQNYTLSYGVATCLIFILVLFVPESPRWLLANGKVDEAIIVITRAAKRNKLDTSKITSKIMKALEELKLKDCQIVKTSYLDFFKSKTLFLLTLAIFILWVTIGVCFYGIYQYISIVGVDPYLTVVILGLIQIPLCPVSTILNKKFGRKISIIVSLIGLALVMLTVIFVPKGSWFLNMLGTLAFIFINVAITVAYVYVLELYPTPLRSIGYAMGSTGAKLGAMVAPFVANLSPLWVPSLCFCIFSTVGGLCCLILPETKGENLKDTIEI